MKPKIVVVGAGVAGMSAGLRAAELGAEVVILEQKYPATGSSGLSAGIYNINSTDLVQVKVRVQTRNQLEVLERDNGMHLARIGYMRLGRNAEHLKMFEEVIELQSELGVEPSTILDPEQAREIVPDMRIDDISGVIYNPKDGHMDGAILCGSLADRADGFGVELRPQTKVTGYESIDGRHRLLTGEDHVDADIVINAAGGWAMALGEMLGHPLVLVNQIHEVIKVKLPTSVDYTVPMIQEYIPGGPEAGYFRQDGPDSLIAGMHTYSTIDKLGSSDPDDYQNEVTWDTLEPVAQNVSHRLEVEGLGFDTGWSGLYPISEDGEYVVGPYADDPTVIACGGFGGQGLTAAVSVGPLAAEWALLGEPRSLPEAEAWLPDRPDTDGKSSR